MEISTPHLDTIVASKISIWVTFPENLTQEEFSNSPYLLYHGSAKKFEYSQDGDFSADDREGSSTLGFGLYCTDSKEIAQHFASIRWPENAGHIWEFLPKTAMMLDFRWKQNKWLPVGIAQYYFQKFREYKLPEKHRWTQSQLHSRHTDHLNFMENKIWKWENIDLRELLQTWNNESGATPLSATLFGVWEDTMHELGIDGVIYTEGVDGLENKTAASYIFYNTTVIGSFENWKNQWKTKKTVEKIINPPLA